MNAVCLWLIMNVSNRTQKEPFLLEAWVNLIQLWCGSLLWLLVSSPLPPGVRRACCAWCPTSLPSGRAGAGCGSRSRCPSRWWGTTASSTPPHWPSPTRQSLGRGRTAARPAPSCEPGPPACWAAAARRRAPACTAPTAPPTQESHPHPPPPRPWSPNAHRGPLNTICLESNYTRGYIQTMGNNKNWLTLKCCVLIFGYKEAEMENVGGTKGANTQEGVTSQRGQPMEMSEHASWHASSPVVTLRTRLFRSGVWTQWSSCRLRAPAPFYGRENGNHNNNTSTVYKTKPSCVERKVYFCAALLPLLLLPRPLISSHHLFYNYSFLFYSAFLCGFPAGGLDVLLLEGVRGCRGTHMNRDDNIVFMDQGSCISFSKGTFFSIPFLY